ncbi:DUF378 domain-containing protein [Clostridium sp. 19966]|uniref:DUF378 domain-containing protein n=1 Tax=Clostridium sp. 19966 TaxID=2768166 RepID=UPI0028E004C3|nr:DUF378 domain-containing protein [Clostridium sp. 19966]MDT8716399.1 DUF378 domain-containing protein [Clostridium sp. 19966]
MYKLSLPDKITIILVLIGALNWGFIGIGNNDFNIVAQIANAFGFASSVVERIIYLVIGLSALNVIYLLYILKHNKFN